MMGAVPRVLNLSPEVLASMPSPYSLNRLTAKLNNKLKED